MRQLYESLFYDTPFRRAQCGFPKVFFVSLTKKFRKNFFQTLPLTSGRKTPIENHSDIISLKMSDQTTPLRKIIHVDMDAFFTSVEELDRPELKGQPVVVGGSPEKRGVIAGASYAARKFGVRSAMSSKVAQRLCPRLIFVRPHFERYKEISNQVFEIFESYTEKVEGLSVDEAYLDVTENRYNELSATKLAMAIKNEIKSKTGLTASAGVGPNKLIAKIASDYKKPDGLFVVRPEQVLNFLKDLPVEKLWGVGPSTAERLHALGVFLTGEIRNKPREFWVEEFGKFGSFLFDLSLGHDDREVDSSWDPKSRGAEVTFDKDLRKTHELEQALKELVKEVCEDIETKLQRIPRTLTLKVRFSDFQTLTRSRTSLMGYLDPAKLPELKLDHEQVLHVALGLFHRLQLEYPNRPIRLLGFSVSSFLEGHEEFQLPLPYEGLSF